MNCKTAKLEYNRLTNMELKYAKKIGYLNRLLSGEDKQGAGLPTGLDGQLASPELIDKISIERLNAEAMLREVKISISQLDSRYGFLRKEVVNDCLLDKHER